MLPELRESPEQRALLANLALPVSLFQFPPLFFGKVTQGRIADVINGGRGRYGFINFGTEDATETTPRVYFNFTDYQDAEFVARKGYTVEFLVSKDESDRAFASNVRLTAAGRAQAAEREARIAADKPRGDREPRERKPAAEGAAAGAGEGGERKRRERPPRVRPEDDRSVTLRVSCEGKPDVKIVIAKLGQSIGKLKHSATEAFEAPTTLNVFYNNELLTKAILRTLNDNDTIHLKEPVAATA